MAEANYRKQWAEGEIEAGTLLDAIDALRAELSAIKAPPVVAEAEPVEVVGFRSRWIDPPQNNPAWQLGSMAEHPPKPWIEEQPLMTVAQHQRIVAAHTAPPASGAVPVPRELLERVADLLDDLSPPASAEQYAVDELRALLAKGDV